MSGMVLVEIAIGLVLFYLLLSLFCTIINEWIAQIFNLRSSNLEKGIRQMLADPNLEGLAKQVCDHPIIKNSGKPGKMPSYLSPSLFARALVDVVDPNAKDAADAAQAVRSFRDAVKSSQLPADVTGPMLALVDQGVSSLDDLRAGIASWFDDSMDRAAGWYKRRVRWISLAVGVIVTIALNADTIHVANTLWKEPGLRAETAAAAATIVAECEGGEEEECAAKRASLDDLKADLGAFPLGWGGGVKAGMHGGSAPLGWILTALALSLGAPFWFDTLNKLNAVSSSGPKPAKSKEGGA